MDIGRSFTFVFEDEEWWKKILIGGLIGLIPIFGQFYLIGYMVTVMKRTIDGYEVPLPEATEDLMGMAMKGLMVFLISLVYALPIILINGCLGGGLGVAMSQMNSSEVDTVAVIGGSCIGCLGLILGIVYALIFPFALGAYADTGEFGAAFRFGDIFAMAAKSIGPLLITLLVSLLLGIVISIVSSITCGLGIPFAMLFAQICMGYVYGSLYNKGKSLTL